MVAEKQLTHKKDGRLAFFDVQMEMCKESNFYAITLSILRLDRL